MHDEIIKYSIDGSMSDSKFLQNRDRLIEFVEDQMRSEGLAPLIDMEPQFTVDYKPESETYDFSLSVYGIYVGSEEAWQTSGVTSGKRILKVTPKDKSKAS